MDFEINFRFAINLKIFLRWLVIIILKANRLRRFENVSFQIIQSVLFNELLLQFGLLSTAHSILIKVNLVQLWLLWYIIVLEAFVWFYFIIVFVVVYISIFNLIMNEELCGCLFYCLDNWSLICKRDFLFSCFYKEDFFIYIFQQII